MIDAAAELINKNQWQVFPCTANKAKAPIVPKGKSWKKKKYSVKPTHDVLQKARKGTRNIACVMPDDVVVIDIDDKKQLKPLCRACDINLLKSTLVISSGRGYHLYYKRGKYPNNKIPLTVLKGKTDLFKDVDIRRNGYMLIPPSLHYLKKQHYVRVDNAYMTPQPLPKELRKLLRKLYAETTAEKDYLTESDVKRLQVTNGKEPYLTMDDYRTALDALSPSLFGGAGSKDYFFKLLASCHHTMRGDTEAREVFIQWARNDPEYNDKECIENNRRMWNACKK